MFQGSFKVFTESFKGVSRTLQGNIKHVSRKFQLRLKGVLSSFKGVSRVFERS